MEPYAHRARFDAVSPRELGRREVVEEARGNRLTLRFRELPQCGAHGRVVRRLREGRAGRDSGSCDALVPLDGVGVDRGVGRRSADTGRPMPGLVLPTGICPTSDTDLEDLPEGGFGWHLIHTLTEELSYRRESTRNQTRFIIPLSGGT